MKRIICIGLTIMVLLSFASTAFASESETVLYDIPELGLNISVSSDYFVLTRDIQADDPFLSASGFSREEWIQYTEDNSIYFDAYNPYTAKEIVITMTENLISDLSLLPDRNVDSILKSLVKKHEDTGATVIDHGYYQSNGLKYIKLNLSAPDGDYTKYGLIFSTVYNYMSINILFFSTDEELSSADKAAAQNVVDSIIFSAAGETVANPPKSNMALEPVSETTPQSDTAAASAVSTEDLLQTANSYYEKRDFEAAFEWYQKSAEAGNAEAMNSIGYMYDNGLGVPQDNDRALEWFQKAAEEGNADAMYSIGRRYYYVGKGLPVDVATAIKWFERAAEAGNANAMFLIGDAYYSGRVGERDYTGAMGWFQRAANAGNEDAMFLIGYMYEFGEGVPQDMEKAQEWYDKYDAAHGDIKSSVASKAQLSTNEADAENLFAQGDKYRLNGDYAAAMGYYRKAADMGNSAAMRMIGLLYQSGDGVAVDYEKALEWYLKAADLGDTTAMHNIGFLYSRGLGVTQDENKANEWYAKAGDGAISIRNKDDSVAYTAAPFENDFTTLILKELNNETFKDAYRALSEGEVIQSGSYGSAVKGLQQTLNAFGQNLGVDGSAGSRTISALNEVQDAFGFEETDTLDADRYSELLSALLLLENPESAEKLLPGHMSRGQYQFMQACALVMQGKNYSARELFEKCSYRDWAKRATDCALPWPATGVIWKDSSLGGGTELTVKVNEVPDLGMYIKIYKDGTTPAAQLFVGGSGSVTVSLPSGSYTIKDGTGKTWFGPEESFGRTGSYEIMTFEDGSTETELESGYGYTITINVTVPSHDAETVESRDINYDAF